MQTDETIEEQEALTWDAWAEDQPLEDSCCTDKRLQAYGRSNECLLESRMLGKYL